MDFLTILLIVVAIIITLVGIAGAILPALPGPPLSFASLLMTYFICPGQISLTLLIVMLVVTIFVSIVDYIAPTWMTKVGGGSKAGINGTTIGMLIGLFFMPWGMVIGPFAGALIGELIAHTAPDKALKLAFLSFIAFLLTTGLKLIASFIMTFYTVVAIWRHVATLSTFTFQ